MHGICTADGICVLTICISALYDTIHMNLSEPKEFLHMQLKTSPSLPFLNTYKSIYDTGNMLKFAKLSTIISWI